LRLSTNFLAKTLQKTSILRKASSKSSLMTSSSK
jgi:hypothetical protein